MERVNRAIDHVIQNLDQPVRLEDVARVAFFSVCVHVPAELPRGRVAGRREPGWLPGAAARAARPLRRIDWLFKTWLPRSVYVPTDQPSFEAWIGRPFAHGTEHFEIFAQLPVQRG